VTAELLRLTARGAQGVFVVRQRGRQVAAALGFDQPSQVRIATALSEVCRHLLPEARSCVVTFALTDAPPDCLQVTLLAAGAVPAGAGSGLAEGVRAARRLMDTVELSQQPAQVSVSLSRRLGPHPLPSVQQQIERVRAELAHAKPASALEELGAQNQELMSALDELQSQRDQLLRLNAELEETNRGVMALYSQLSEELEQTNRGVVALYAELDARSAQLRDASEAKSRFMRNVSHELRGPVTASIGMIRLLLDPRSDPLTAEQIQQLELMRGSMNDLLSLVNQLLDLAKAESNRLEPQWTRVDLRAVFRQLRGTLRPLARPEVTLVVADPADLPALITDEVMLVQVLRNLVTNGLKFTVEGEVRLAVRPADDGRGVLISVSDTGIGIPEAEQERVFEEFYQVRNSHQQPGAGTGLGLPYARRLATLLGGTLALTSSPGRGTTLALTLPLSPSDEDIEPPPPPAGQPGQPGRLGRVLVADDDAVFRYRITQAITEVAGEVTEVGDGQEALAAIRAQRPDAVVLDLRMPRMGGLELLAILADDPSLRAIPVVVVTAAELDDVVRGPVAHAVGVLDKATLTDADLVRTLGGIGAAAR
jgi:signal transduction histidine kinase